MSDTADAVSDAASNSITPWSVRGVSYESRNAALRAAERAGVPIGKWLSGAILVAIKAERGQPRAVATLQQTWSVSAREAHLDMIDRLIDAARRVAIDTGEAMPRSTVRLIHSVIRDRLRLARQATRAPASDGDAISSDMGESNV
jgi:hypothetical protein